MITCVQLIPYVDSKTDTSKYDNSGRFIIADCRTARTRGLGAALSSIRNINDEVTPFVRRVGELTINGLLDEIKPDRTSRWGVGGPNLRHYQFWYSSPPWGNWKMSYRIDLYPQKEVDLWRVKVLFIHDQNGLEERLTDLDLHNQRFATY